MHFSFVNYHLQSFRFILPDWPLESSGRFAVVGLMVATPTSLLSRVQIVIFRYTRVICLSSGTRNYQTAILHSSTWRLWRCPLSHPPTITCTPGCPAKFAASPQPSLLAYHSLMTFHHGNNAQRLGSFLSTISPTPFLNNTEVQQGEIGIVTTLPHDDLKKLRNAL